ncbi:MAG: LysR substrate-binding domain-containing protein, partial [Pusillimonas sp.]
KKNVAAFPACLETLPVLLPTGHSELRWALDRWFHAQGLRPRVVGEFEDSALMAVFAAQGMGVFPVSHYGAEKAGLLKGLRFLGSDPGVCEEVYAIRTPRGCQHALASELVAAVR